MNKKVSAKRSVPDTVEIYISTFPKTTQLLLKTLRKTIKDSAPKAEELISYGMPAYKLNGPLVYFAGFSKHIGFYPTPSVISKFKKEIARYKSAKGSVQFPLDKPIPVSLIRRMVKYRIKVLNEKQKTRNLKEGNRKK